MLETILNIFIIIEKGFVMAFKVKAYKIEGGDDDKIKFLKSRTKEDLPTSYHFDAPVDKKGQFMTYRRFSKFERQGMQYRLFEHIFDEFELPEKPLICVTPVVDGEIYAG
ncbi:MAG: hypothetical protein V1720_19260 [bacterium]